MKVIYNDQEYLLVKQNSSTDIKINNVIKTNNTITKYSELVKIKCLLTGEVLSVPKSKVIFIGDVE